MALSEACGHPVQKQGGLQLRKELKMLLLTWPMRVSIVMSGSFVFLLTSLAQLGCSAHLPKYAPEFLQPAVELKKSNKIELFIKFEQ